MSTPPFIAMPDGVALFAPPTAPAPVLLAEPGAGVTSGADGARGDVLLVPGFTGSKEDFIAILAPLAARGWRVAAMDLPGQGGFAGLGPRGSHTPEALADSVLSVAEWFAPGRRVHLVGHSMGGIVTRAAVLADPGRMVSWSAVCSGPGPIPAQGHASLLELQEALAALPMEHIWVRKEELDRAGGWDPPSDEVAEFCARRFIANDPAALSDFADILMRTADRTEEAAATIAAAGVAGAVVTGALDDAWPVAEQGQMAQRLGVAWHVIPDVGHNPATEDPAGTVAVLDGIFASASAGG
jgi:pimeloyl-ACP methyl ester carboxylesterase